MPLKVQILISPVIIIAVLIGLAWYTLTHYANIRAENENVQQWGRITDRMHIAISAGQRMESIAKQMMTAPSEVADDLQFNYLEQYQIFSESVLYPECVDKLSNENRKFISQLDQSVSYKDDLKPGIVHTDLHQALPRLESIYNSFYVQKRSAYIDYYHYFNNKGSQLVSVLIYSILLCVVLAAILSLWTIKSLRSRIQYLTNYSKAICDGQIASSKAPVKISDELDELSLCLAKMTEKLINVVAIEKVLEGAEEERRRIAMDIHDDSLAKLTGVIRNVDSLVTNENSRSDTHVDEIKEIRSDLAQLLNNLRNIIDDLHPQSLELLGLEPTIRAFLEKQSKIAGMPEFSLHVEGYIDKLLLPLQKLYLYRIVLETITNIIRHANCDRFEIVFRVLSGELILTIEDNGVGFDSDALSVGSGHGLHNIGDRATAIGATINWGKSRFSSGSKLECRLQLESH